MRGRIGVAGLVVALTYSLPAHAAPRVLLPNLVPLPTTTLFVGGPATYTVSGRNEPIAGCEAGEVVHDSPSPERCLRFETHAANAGTGPLEIRYRFDSVAGDRVVFQRIYNADRTYADRPAGTYVVEPTHGHIHFTDFAVAYLWRTDARGRRLGKTPLRTSHKAGFCLEDVYAYRSAGAATYDGATRCYPTTVTPDGEVSQVNGISPGWVDVYDITIPGQYIEISGVPDGNYLLEIVVDPLHRLREATTKDNAVWQRVRLHGDAANLVGAPSPARRRPGSGPPLWFPAFAGPCRTRQADTDA